jgi:hypothetical protein
MGIALAAEDDTLGRGVAVKTIAARASPLDTKDVSPHQPNRFHSVV